MAPKTTPSTIILLLALTLSLAMAAANNGCPGNSVKETLRHYGLPGGLFPDYVKSFTCEPASDSNHAAVRIKIELEGKCTVTREVGLKNVVECEPEISATMSHAQLTDVKGITIKLYFLNQQVGELMTVTAVKVQQDLLWGRTLQFFSAEGLNSPKFPLFFFPNEPPHCDSSFRVAPAFGNSDPLVNQDDDLPDWVYKYGRLIGRLDLLAA